MSDPSSSLPTDPQQQPTKVRAAVQLQLDVKASLAEAEKTNGARQRVIDGLVEDVLTKRTQILTEALSKRKEKEAQLKKIKPVVSFENGQPKETYSKEAWEDKQKKESSLERLDILIDKVIEDPTSENYDRLAKAK